MRSLAIARFRLLNGIRSCDWVFGVALFWVAVPLAVSAGVHLPASLGQLETTYRNAQLPSMLIVIYAVHLMALIGAADVVGSTASKKGENVATTDLLDTVPIDWGSRFIGDSAGIAASIATVHVATMPLLFLAAAVSPIGPRAVLWIEAAVFSLIVFAGFLVGSKARHVSTAWERSRPVRTLATVVVLIVVWLALTTRLFSFRDAVGAIILDPAPRTWAALTATVHNPLLLAMLTAATFGGAIAYLYMHAVRPERSR